jgi:hypothetical protein
MKRVVLSLGLTAAFCFFALVNVNPAHAQKVPYKASGSDAKFNPGTGDFSGPGNGTHVGRVFLEGRVADALTPNLTDPTAPFLKGPFSGTQTVTAANGDTIEWKFSGTVCLEWVQGGPIDPSAAPIVEGKWDVTFDITGGTGRFEHVSGIGLRGAAINPPFNPFAGPWPFDWFVNGTIDLGKKGKKK